MPTPYYDHTIRSSFAHASWSMRKRCCFNCSVHLKNYNYFRTSSSSARPPHFHHFLGSQDWRTLKIRIKGSSNRSSTDGHFYILLCIRVRVRNEVKIAFVSAASLSSKILQHFQPIRHKSETHWNLFAQIFPRLSSLVKYASEITLTLITRKGL